MRGVKCALPLFAVLGLGCGRVASAPEDARRTSEHDASPSPRVDASPSARADASPSARADASPSVVTDAGKACDTEAGEWLAIVYDVRNKRVLGSSAYVSASIVGIARELGKGIPPEVADAIPSVDFASRDLRWMRVTSAAIGEWLVVAQPAEGFAVKIGSPVEVSYLRETSNLSFRGGALRVRVGEQLAFYAGTALNPSALRLVGDARFSGGPGLCKVHEECGDYEVYSLAVELAGQTAMLGTGQSATLGGYRVTHRRTAQQVPNSPYLCADWLVSDSTVSIEHVGELVPSGRPTCSITTFSTLEGAQIEMDHERCRITLAEARQGVQFYYRVVMGSDTLDVISKQLENCRLLDPIGLHVDESMVGNGQYYSPSSGGGCEPASLKAHGVSRGTYPGSFAWDGRNSSDPSDAGHSAGPLFPAGQYEFTVRSVGSSKGGDFEMESALSFVLE